MQPGRAPLLTFNVLTLFPELFGPFVDGSIMGRARRNGLIGFQAVQIRDFATDRHHTVDDSPFGGGEGMVLRPDVLHSAWTSVDAPDSRAKGEQLTVYLSPQGRALDANLAKRLAGFPRLILVCGHYEGVDERFVESCVDLEVSIGDYVLTGGELPAQVLMDAVSRWVPGVVGKERSVAGDSLEGGLLKYPQYTKPREYLGRAVPDVLLSGNHAEIARWRQEQRERRTEARRPDLWTAYGAPRKGGA
ncbi:MAG: tRNA (guanosine(37)-N1)-methyltransferase TrmD [Bdellovibrionales bacterium]|nr:tRNA (guanosine(37)-N1)-methyltransferase TrmD [Bdellovibrionales bacterium]